MASGSKIRIKIGKKCNFFPAPPGGKNYKTRLNPILKRSNFCFWSIQFGQTGKKLWPIFIFKDNSVRKQCELKISHKYDQIPHCAMLCSADNLAHDR